MNLPIVADIALILIGVCVGFYILNSRRKGGIGKKRKVYWNFLPWDKLARAFVGTEYRMNHIAWRKQKIILLVLITILATVVFVVR